MRYSIRTLLIIQAVVAVLCYLSGYVNLLYLCVVLFPFMWLIAAIWGTVRIASRQGNDSLFFRRAKPTAPPPADKQLPEPTTRFLDALEKSRLLTVEQLEEFQHHSCSETQWESLCADPKHLAEALIEQHLLTRWQADRLLEGQYEGFILNKYKLLELIGSGTSSHVYLAENTVDFRQFALKVFSKNRTEYPEELDRFLRAIHLSGMLSHPRFIPSHALIQAGDHPYQVLEYEPGEDLERLVKECGPLDCLSAVKYLAQATEGVDAMHALGVAHRDLKPENLYLTAQHGLKILGISLARSFSKSARRTAEREQVDFESPDFLAPEVVNNPQALGPPSDLYSLGCIFYFLISGKVPFPANSTEEKTNVDLASKNDQTRGVCSPVSFEETIRRHQSEPIPPLESYLENVPQADRLVTIYRRMMAKQPVERYPSAGILLKDLEDYLREVGETSE